MALTQMQEHCQRFRTELKTAFQNQDPTLIKLQYHKLLYACGVNSEDQKMVEQFYASKNVELGWKKDKSYQVYTKQTLRTESGAFTFSELENNHPLRKKYSTEEQFLKASGLDKKQLAVGPFILTDYNAIFVYHDEGDWLLDATDFSVLISFENQQKNLDYVGKGIFLMNHPDKCSVVALHKQNERPKIKTILSQQEGTVQVFSKSINDPQKYFSIVDDSKEKENVSLYNLEGKKLIDGQDGIELNPTTGMIILRKNWKFTLTDIHQKLIYENAGSITEMGKMEEPYYIINTSDGKRHVVNKAGEMIFSGTDYTSVMISDLPYAVVAKNGQDGVVDVRNGEVIIPFQQYSLQELYPGFFGYDNYQGLWTILDNTNTQIATIQSRRMRVLNAGRLVTSNTNRKMGVCDLFGNEILPQIYDDVQLHYMGDALELTTGGRKVLTDFDGKEIKK